MALTAHKTVAMFMRYVHTEDNPVRQAAELVATPAPDHHEGAAAPAPGGHDMSARMPKAVKVPPLPAGYAGIHDGMTASY